ncbi:lactonase family protein [Lewinella sp. JB7]|uniref:lactonase family protein n=1 Tax=Lewinella sp. JB7 TaxID=2962887 RepID=UPI0020CA0738|nr:lactonase family protein [Lewinella sp. JB7]MCP9235807.1 lactonase family protein [Lewinella sp. JB7]
MRYLILFLTLAAVGACSRPGGVSESPSNSPSEETFLLGTYDDPGVHEPGIYRFALVADGTVTNRGRVVEAENPSFLAYSTDRSVLVSVEQVQQGDGRVVSFAVAGDSLSVRNRQTSGGNGPCHVNVGPQGYVMVANYNGGNAELLRIDGRGNLSEPLDLQDHRQRGAETPHAHSSYFLNGGTEVLSVDLGTDEVWHYRIDTAREALIPMTPPAAKMKDGAGPRHLSVHPNGRWIYVINELNSTVTQLERRDGKLTVRDSWSTLPDDFAGESFCADVHVSTDGRFLYGSNRGHNSIVAYAIDQATGALTTLEHEPVAGDWPRNFALSPREDFLLVANQRSKNITTLRRDADTGLLDYVSSVSAPVPVCILF